MAESPLIQEIGKILGLSPLYVQSSPSKKQESLKYLSLILANSSDNQILTNRPSEVPDLIISASVEIPHG
jgi:hypothetical protein